MCRYVDIQHFRRWLNGHGGIVLMVGLADLRGHFQPKEFYDSKINFADGCLSFV